MSGQAASYYNPSQGFEEAPPQQPQQPYQQPYQQSYQQSYQQPVYNPQQQQQQPYAPYPNQGVPESKPPEHPPTYDQAVYGFDEAFKIEKPKLNDLWAGLLLIAVFLGYAAISGLTIHRYAKYKGFNGGGIYDAGNEVSLNTNTLVLFIFVLCVAIVFSWAYFMGARFFPKTFIWVTGILNIVLALATGIYYICRKQYGGGIAFLVFGVFAIICFISWIPRIPFTAFMLQTSMDVTRKYGHVFVVSALGGIVAVAFAAWFSVTLVAVYVAYEPTSSSSGRAGAVDGLSGTSSAGNPSCSNGGCSRARVIGLVVYVTFAMYWVSEWIKNTVHTTIAGIYGSWYYFCGEGLGGQGGKKMPKGSTRGAFKRATTYSFGSISLGSLFIAIINMLRQACSIAQRHEAAEGNTIGCVFAWILGSCISLLDWLVTLFNRYAFCHIALWGKAYIPAAKDTWAMMRDRGVDALVNDCLMGPVLTMGSVGVSYICALLAYLYLQFTNPGYNADGNFTAVIMAFAFVIGLQVAQIFLTPVGSGIETIFAAMAWDPEVMMREHPGLYQELIKVYPKVQQAVHA